MPATTSTKRERQDTEKREGMRDNKRGKDKGKSWNLRVGRHFTELLKENDNSNSTQIGNVRLLNKNSFLKQKKEMIFRIICNECIPLDYICKFSEITPRK